MTKKAIAFLLIILTATHLAEAQQPKKVPRIGYLSPRSSSVDSERVTAFRQGLRELGYVEGQNIAVEYKFAEGKLDRLLDLARELVHLNVNVIISDGATATKTVKDVTKVIP